MPSSRGASSRADKRRRTETCKEGTARRPATSSSSSSSSSATSSSLSSFVTDAEVTSTPPTPLQTTADFPRNNSLNDGDDDDSVTTAAQRNAQAVQGCVVGRGGTRGGRASVSQHMHLLTAQRHVFEKGLQHSRRAAAVASLISPPPQIPASVAAALFAVSSSSSAQRTSSSSFFSTSSSSMSSATTFSSSAPRVTEGGGNNSGERHSMGAVLRRKRSLRNTPVPSAMLISIGTISTGGETQETKGRADADEDCGCGCGDADEDCGGGCGCGCDAVTEATSKAAFRTNSVASSSSPTPTAAKRSGDGGKRKTPNRDTTNVTPASSTSFLMPPPTPLLVTAATSSTTSPASSVLGEGIVRKREKEGRKGSMKGKVRGGEEEEGRSALSSPHLPSLSSACRDEDEAKSGRGEEKEEEDVEENEGDALSQHLFTEESASLLMAANLASSLPSPSSSAAAASSSPPNNNINSDNKGGKARNSSSSAAAPSSNTVVAMGAYISESSINTICKNLLEGVTYVDSSVKITSKDVAASIAAEKMLLKGANASGAAARLGDNDGGGSGGAAMPLTDDDEDDDGDGDAVHFPIDKKATAARRRAKATGFSNDVVDDGSLFRPIGAIFAKRCIPLEMCARAATLLEKAATRHNRRILTNGGNEPPETGIVGYYDYKTNPAQYKCRETEFTRNNLPSFAKACAPLLKKLNEVYALYAPRHHQLQMQTIPHAYKLFGTCFSTITVNKNFRTAAHVDRGDFKSGLGVVAVLAGSGHMGCYLAIPKLNLAFDLEVGDCLLFDTSHIHGNTEVFVQVTEEELAKILQEAGLAESPSSSSESADERSTLNTKDVSQTKKALQKKGSNAIRSFSSSQAAVAVINASVSAFKPNILRRRGNRVFVEVPFGTNVADPTDPATRLAAILYPRWRRISVVAYLRSGLATPLCWQDRADRYAKAQHILRLQQQAGARLVHQSDVATALALQQRGMAAVAAAAAGGKRQKGRKRARGGNGGEEKNGHDGQHAMSAVSNSRHAAADDDGDDEVAALLDALGIPHAALSVEADVDLVALHQGTHSSSQFHPHDDDDLSQQEKRKHRQRSQASSSSAAAPSLQADACVSRPRMLVPGAIAALLTQTQTEALVFAATKLAYPCLKATAAASSAGDAGPSSQPSQLAQPLPLPSSQQRPPPPPHPSSSSPLLSSFTKAVSGCILALPMGQGKTLVGLLAAYNHFKQWPHEDVIVVAPKAVLSHWQREAFKWSRARAEEGNICGGIGQQGKGGGGEGETDEKGGGGYLQLPPIVTVMDTASGVDTARFERDVTAYNRHIEEVRQSRLSSHAHSRRRSGKAPMAASASTTTTARSKAKKGGARREASVASTVSAIAATAPLTPPPPPLMAKVGHLFIVNYERVAILRKRCPTLRPGLILLDEGHRIGSSSTSVTLAQHQKRQIKRSVSRTSSSSRGRSSSSSPSSVLLLRRSGGVVKRGSNAKRAGSSGHRVRGSKSKRDAASSDDDTDEDSTEDDEDDDDDDVCSDPGGEALEAVARREQKERAKCLPSLCKMTATRSGGQRRRTIIFTGTPLQNDTHELYRLVEFVAPHVTLTFPFPLFQQKVAPIERYLSHVSAGDVLHAHRVNDALMAAAAAAAGKAPHNNSLVAPKVFTAPSGEGEEEEEASENLLCQPFCQPKQHTERESAAMPSAPLRHQRDPLDPTALVSAMTPHEQQLFSRAVAAQEYVLEWLRTFMYRGVANGGGGEGRQSGGGTFSSQQTSESAAQNIQGSDGGGKRGRGKQLSSPSPPQPALATAAMAPSSASSHSSPPQTTPLLSYTTTDLLSYTTTDLIVVCNLSALQQTLINQYGFYGGGGGGGGSKTSSSSDGKRGAGDGVVEAESERAKLQLLLSANEHRPFHLTAHPLTFMGFVAQRRGDGAGGVAGGPREEEEEGVGGGNTQQSTAICERSYIASVLERLCRKPTADALSLSVPKQPNASSKPKSNLNTPAHGAAARPSPSSLPLSAVSFSVGGPPTRKTPGVGASTTMPSTPTAVVAATAASSHQSHHPRLDDSHPFYGQSPVVEEDALNAMAAFLAVPSTSSSSSSSPSPTENAAENAAGAVTTTTATTAASASISSSSTTTSTASVLLNAFLRDSGKLLVAVSLIIHAAVIRGEKIVVLTQYVAVQQLLWDVLAALGVRCAAVSGGDGCAARDASIDAFTQTTATPTRRHQTATAFHRQKFNSTQQQQQQQPCNVLLITNRTGSYGLDLTAANHLILFDSWWNPQMDAQATARIDRRNQVRNVFIYRLATVHEEQIVLLLHVKKLLLFDWIINGYQRGGGGGDSGTSAARSSSPLLLSPEALAVLYTDRSSSSVEDEQKKEEKVAQVGARRGDIKGSSATTKNACSIAAHRAGTSVADDAQAAAALAFWRLLMTVPLNGPPSSSATSTSTSSSSSSASSSLYGLPAVSSVRRYRNVQIN